MNIRKRITLATPLICLIIYLAIGFTLNIWHPTWAIFFLIIIVPELMDENFAWNIYPLLCLVAYLAVGFSIDLWHPTWLIFLTIPVYYILFAPIIKKKTKKKFFEYISS